MEHSRNVINFCFWEKYILRWFPVVGCPSLLSASGILKYFGFDVEHDYRWFEQDASALGAHYFNRHYGTGSAGYMPDSENHFQLDTFYGKKREPHYATPRPTKHDMPQDQYFPLHSPTLSFWDFIIL